MGGVINVTGVFHVIEVLCNLTKEWWYRVVFNFAVVVSIVKLSVSFLKVLCGWPENNGTSLVSWFDDGVR